MTLEYGVARGSHFGSSVDRDGDGPLAWQGDALCAQTDIEAFFPEHGSSVRAAKKICAMCEVKGQCLRYALENDEKSGVWGGLDSRERKALKKRGGLALEQAMRAE